MGRKKRSKSVWRVLPLWRDDCHDDNKKGGINRVVILHLGGIILLGVEESEESYKDVNHHDILVRVGNSRAGKFVRLVDPCRTPGKTRQ